MSNPLRTALCDTILKSTHHPDSEKKKSFLWAFFLETFAHSMHSDPCFWTHLGLKYSRLPKFIQKIDRNARMSRIFMDSLDKSAF